MMRMGVLDAGSNTVHLAVVDGYPGSPLLPVIAVKQRLRLAQCTNSAGAIEGEGVRALVSCVRRACVEAERFRVEELYALATAAIRDAMNSMEVLTTVRQETGVQLQVLAGEDEARLTFVAARRWFGWSAGPLLLLDIGGGSAEVAWGRSEEPTFSVSLPLGAGRLTRTYLPADPPSRDDIEAMTAFVKEHVGALRERLDWDVSAVRPVATSRTFQQLARLCGAPPLRQGIFAQRQLRADDLAVDSAPDPDVRRGTFEPARDLAGPGQPDRGRRDRRAQPHAGVGRRRAHGLPMGVAGRRPVPATGHCGR
jgi:exopolyphosphatase / guanosine-5'-triphosphate,3'-diphosphate pyrophosphatase